MKLKRHINFIDANQHIKFINEGYDSTTGVRDDMMKKLKKKAGARNVNNQINYKERDYDNRLRTKINWKAFASMYIQYAVEDYSLINEDNWKIIWNGISVHNIRKDENGKDFIKYMIDNFNPSQEMVDELFKNVITSKMNPVTEYLLPMVDKNSIRKMVSNSIPYGLGYSSNEGKRAKLFYSLGLYKFKGEPENDKNVTYIISQDMLLKFMGYNEIDEIAWEAMSKKGFEWEESFFEKMLEHPNNGGINSSENRLEKALNKFSQIPSFKKYIIEHPKVVLFDSGIKSILYDFLPEEIQQHEKVQNFIRSKKGIKKFNM